MSIVINLLMVLLVALCLLMLLIILMQRPKQEGLGAAFGGGMMDGMLGAGTTNFLQKGTVYLTVGYFVLTMTLAVIQARTSEARSLQGKNLEVAPAAAATPVDDENASVAEDPAQLDTGSTDDLIPPAPTDDTTAPTPADDTPTPADDTTTSVPTDDAAATVPSDGTPDTVPADDAAAPAPDVDADTGADPVEDADADATEQSDAEVETSSENADTDN